MPVSTGLFAITSQRAVFKGDTKSFSYRFDQLLGMDLFSDGLTLADSKGKSRAVSIRNSADLEMMGAIWSRIVNNPES